MAETAVELTMREALERFGQHHRDCGVWHTGSVTSGPDDVRCDCGLRAALAAPPVRRRTVAGCSTCEAEPDGFRPYHDASPRCESGGRPHCTCDRCF